MVGIRLTRRQENALQRYQHEYRRLKKELDELGFVMPGSVVKRWMVCGKYSCRCRVDPQALHGPYYQLSAKKKGKTVCTYLDTEQYELCKQWIKNNRRLEKILKRLRSLSMRVARLYKIGLK